MTLEVQGTVQECPILAGGTGKEGGMLRQILTLVTHITL